MSSRPRPAWIEHAAVLAAFTLSALVMSFPLITQFRDHIAGVDGDVWSYLWTMGWARVSLLNLGINPFHTDYIFYPLGGATQLLWGTALPSITSLPLQLAFGLVPAFNLMYLVSSVLTGYGMYLLTKSVLRHVLVTADSEKLNYRIQLAALVAGFGFTFGALRLGYGLAFTNLFHTEFIPFYVLMLLRATRIPDWKNAILAGFFFALNVYIDFQIAAFLAVLTGIWFVYIGISAVKKSNQFNMTPLRTGLLGRWLVLIVVAGLLSLPMLGFLLDDFAIEGGNYIRVYPLQYSVERSYDLLSFVVPNARSTLYQNLLTPRVAGVNVSVTTP
ncbi:MAG TPA: hypothetical protein VFD70_14930, partial [Anaerolineae bacterium]|nr:hypothetical protein [Anaerolineae bacterium]